MKYNVGTLWIIYIIVLVLGFILCWAVLYFTHNMNFAMAFFLATLLGLIAVIIGSFWLDVNNLNSTDKTWLTVLYVVAFVLPIIALVCMLVFMNKGAQSSQNMFAKKDVVNISKDIKCDTETQLCEFEDKKYVKNGNTTTTERVTGVTSDWNILSEESFRKSRNLPLM